MQDEIERAPEVIRRSPIKLGSFRKSDLQSHRANSIQTSIRNLLEYNKKAQSFGERAWAALDTEAKGYLTSKEILEPIIYSGVENHGALQDLIHRVKASPPNHKFELHEFQHYTSHFEFFKKVLQFDLVLHDFDLFANTYRRTFEAILEDREGLY
mmetsp:Transcript_36335/g.26958  ORF Transcript_36335/g.26958 Transcript_36335/m.26958 type:complete len:155 (+) Transcript_36335:67-531(+)